MASLVTNMPSLTAQRNLGMTQGSFHKAVTRLSSGLRINSAADDAAGLYLSEKFKSQIRGLQQASRNAQDGASLIQVAEGALQQVHDMLGRMRELAIQSANGTLTQSDRDIISDEVSELLKEIDRIRVSASFNGMRLLTGERSPSTAVTAGGAYPAGVTNINADGTALINPAGTDYTLTVGALTGAAGYQTAQITIQYPTGAGQPSQTVTVGVPPTGETRIVNFAQWGINVTISDALAAGTQTFDVAAAAAPSGGALSAYGPTLQVGTDNSSTSRLTLSGLNDIGTYALGLTENSATIGGTTVATNWTGATTTTDYEANPAGLLAPNTGDPNTGVAGTAGGVKTQAGAGVALSAIDNAILTVSKMRANLGAYQNRMEYTMTAIGVGVENMTAANSRIRDADVALEVSNMVQAQILSQSAMAVLAQSNSAPQALLSLLR